MDASHRCGPTIPEISTFKRSLLLHGTQPHASFAEVFTQKSRTLTIHQALKNRTDRFSAHLNIIAARQPAGRPQPSCIVWQTRLYAVRRAQERDLEIENFSRIVASRACMVVFFVLHATSSPHALGMEIWRHRHRCSVVACESSRCRRPLSRDGARCLCAPSGVAIASRSSPWGSSNACDLITKYHTRQTVGLSGASFHAHNHTGTKARVAAALLSRLWLQVHTPHCRVYSGTKEMYAQIIQRVCRQRPAFKFL